MWPWGHVAVGYLAYLAYRRWWRGGERSDALALTAVAGTALPDLVDKPLAWTVSVLPTGRTLGHSLPVAAVVLAALWVVARRRGATPLVAALAVGWLSHLGADAVYPLVDLEFAHASFLLWPLVPAVDYSVEQSFAAHLALVTDREAALELALFAVATAVWQFDGRPGLGLLRRRAAALRGGRPAERDV